MKRKDILLAKELTDDSYLVIQASPESISIQKQENYTY